MKNLGWKLRFSSDEAVRHAIKDVVLSKGWKQRSHPEELGEAVMGGSER